MPCYRTNLNAAARLNTFEPFSANWDAMARHMFASQIPNRWIWHWNWIKRWCLIGKSGSKDSTRKNWAEANPLWKMASPSYTGLLCDLRINRVSNRNPQMYSAEIDIRWIFVCNKKSTISSTQETIHVEKLSHRMWIERRRKMIRRKKSSWVPRAMRRRRNSTRRRKLKSAPWRS